MRRVNSIVIPGLGDSREPGTQETKGRITRPWVPDLAARARDDEE